MGGYLEEKLNEGYLAVATSLSKGSFAAVTEDCFGADTEPIIWEIGGDPPPSSANNLFHKARFSNFILDLASLPKNGGLYRFFNQSRPLFGVGDFFTRNVADHYGKGRMARMARFYDVLFHFNDTGAINILKRESE